MKTSILAILLASALLLYGCAGASQNQPPAGGALPPATNPPSPAGASPPPAKAPPAGSAQGNGSQPPAGNGSSAAPAVKEFTIEASKWRFSPDTISVDKGDVVKITLVNKDVSHGISIPDFGFDLKAEAGQNTTGQFTADKAGAFGFRCNVFCGEGHREMTGTLVVK